MVINTKFADTGEREIWGKVEKRRNTNTRQEYSFIGQKGIKSCTVRHWQNPVLCLPLSAGPTSDCK